MTIAGVVLLAASWASIIVLCAFCFYKVMQAPRKNIHAPLEIDTGDLDMEKK